MYRTTKLHKAPLPIESEANSLYFHIEKQGENFQILKHNFQQLEETAIAGILWTLYIG